MNWKKHLLAGCALAAATATALAQPTPEIDEGTLVSSTYFNTVTSINAGAGIRVAWVKFTIPGVSRAAGDFLDIDTTSGTLTGGDSMIGLYDASGNRIAFDDDDGPALWSSLSFGDNINTRPAIGTGVVHNGRDGADLAPGEYWLGITGFGGTSFGLTGWNITSTHTRTGTVDYRIEYYRGVDPSNPSGVGSATPATARNDQNTFVTFQVSVVPGANPTSTAHTVTVDLSSLGMGSSISMTEFSPGIFQYSDTVSSGFGAGTYNLPFTIQETAPQSRTGFGQITFNIINPPSGACCTEDGCFFITESDCNFAGGTYIGDGTTCTGCICASPTTPENDFCVDAILMNIGDFVSGNTCSATPNPEAGVCAGQTLSSGGLWYKVIGNGNTLTADTCSSSGAIYDTRLSVYCGDCNASPMTCIGGNDDSCGLRSRVTFCTQAGATYYILVHGFSAGRGDFTLTVQDSFNPCTPTIQCGPIGVPTGTGTATPNFGRNDQNTFVTFQVNVTPAVNPDSTAHTVTIDLSSLGLSASQTMIETSTNVFQHSDTVAPGFGAGAYNLPFTIQETAPQSRTGSGSITYNVINPPSGACCTEDGCFFITQADCTFAGGTYIGDGTACSGCICASPTTPENDFCADAILMNIGDFVSGNTCSASINTEAGVCAGQTLSSGGLWYKVIGNGNTLTADTCSSSGAIYDTRLSVYCGDCNATPLTCIGGNDDACGLRSSVTFCSQEGATYYILVHGFGAGRGDFTLTVQDTFNTCTPTISCIPTGACCLDTGCETLTADACNSRGGSYLGDGAECRTIGQGVVLGTSNDPFPLPIPDNSPAGIQSFISFNSGTFTSGTAVCVGLTHTWVGDLIITIQSPSGTIVTLIDRVGALIPGAVGDSSNLGGVYCFNDSAEGDIWAEAALGDTAYVLRSGLYRPARALDGGLPFPSLADFDGENLTGTWILTVSDNAGLDLGTVNSFSFEEFEVTDNCGGGCPACAADFNQDGGVDGSDVEAFYIVWETGEACGDVNEDGGVDGGDIEFFFTLWEQGGC
ncbi:MAG: hypothetical protein KF864_07935 [Phycisphaeraceae bacterium]|nr:hypothetical protein [Phycisphaeraceae bacterium]